MNRRALLQLLGLGAAAITVKPTPVPAAPVKQRYYTLLDQFDDQLFAEIEWAVVDRAGCPSVTVPARVIRGRHGVTILFDSPVTGVMKRVTLRRGGKDLCWLSADDMQIAYITRSDTVTISISFA